MNPLTTPPPIGWLLLLYLLVVLPWMSWRSALRFRAARAGLSAPDGKPLPPLTKIFGGTLFMMLLLFLLAWLAGGAYEYAPFWYLELGVREWGLGLAAFGVLLVIRWLHRALRSEAERKAMPVRQLMPRTREEWGMYAALTVAAGITEEYAYRGVGMWALSLWLGSPWPAAAIMATAFGLAHLTQEWKSVAVIVVIALVMHALVALTGTLVVAMVVHVAYDWLAALLLTREMRFEPATGEPSS